jgi:hypothetical protein
MSKFGAGMEKALKASVAVTGAAAAAGAAAFVKITKSALDAAAELEQNVGGSEAVFGHWAEYVQENAQDASYAMGVSANDYLSAANKMGSLLQGAGFSELDSAEMTTEALQRAADVASIMGIDVTDALNAVTAAAKGNFTMMDNLGVAINDTTLKAYAASKGWNKAAIDNMTTQQKVALAMELFMDKTAKYEGNFIKENETLAGALTTLKAEWQNFLAGNIFGQDDVTAENLAEYASHAIDVAVKNLKTIVPRITKGLGIMLKTVGAKLPELMDTLMPGIIEGAGSLLDLLGDALPYLIETGARLLPSIVTGLGKVFVKAGQKAPEILKGLWNGIKGAGEQIGGMIFGMDGDKVKWPTWDDVKEFAVDAWEKIKDGAAKIADWAGGLVFGRKEDGTVDWPTWSDVVTAAEKAWGLIKEGALGLAGLVFGKKADGTVNWPTWEDVKAAALAAWATIKSWAANIWTLGGKIVFGQTAEGEVNWPTWKEVGAKANEIWLDIVAQAKALTGLVLGNSGDAVKVFTDAKESWESLKSTIETKIIDFTSGLTGIDDLNRVKGILSDIGSALVTIGEFYVAFKGIDFVTKGAGTVAGKLEALGIALEAFWSKSAVALEIVAAFESIKNMIQEISENHTILGKDIDWLFPEEDRINKDSKSVWDSVKENAEAWFNQNGKNWEAYTGWIDNTLVKPIEEKFGEVKTWFSGELIPAISEAWNGILSGVNTAITLIKVSWEATVAWFNASVIEPIKGLWQNVKDGVSGVITAIESLWDGLVTWFDEHVISPIKGAWDSVIGPIKEWLGITDTKNVVISVAEQKKTEAVNEVLGSENPTAGALLDALGVSADDYYASLQQHASGLGYVPYDDYGARLHRGEMVLNKSRADAYRQGGFDMNKLTQTVAAAVRAGMHGVQYNFTLDGEKVAQDTYRRHAMDEQAWRFAT